MVRTRFRGPCAPRKKKIIVQMTSEQKRRLKILSMRYKIRILNEDIQERFRRIRMERGKNLSNLDNRN